MFNRLQIDRAILKLIDEEQGINFQRLVVELLRRSFEIVLPHQPHNDGGLDAIVTWSGEKYGVCMSLSGTEAKIRSDCTKSLQLDPSLRSFIFVSAAKITRQRILAVTAHLEQELDSKILIFEREWLITECLHTENAYPTRRILSILPETRPTVPDIVIGRENVIFSAKVFNVITVAHEHQGFAIAVGIIDEKTDEEQINLSLVGSDGAIQTRSLATGADPSLLVHGGKVHASFVRVEGGITKIFATQNLDSDTDWHIVHSTKNRLAAPPILHALGSHVALTWVTSKDWTSQTVELTNSDRATVRDTPIIRHLGRLDWYPVIVARRHATYMLTMVDEGLKIFRLDRGPATAVASKPWPNGSPRPGRFVATLLHDRILIFLDFRGGISSLVYDLGTGEFSDQKLQIFNGFFPSATAVGDRALLAWVGGTPIPNDVQKHAIDPVGAAMLGNAMWANSEASRIGYDLWGPIWLAWITADGELERSFGPCLMTSGAQMDLVLAVSGETGILAVQSYPESPTTLSTREFLILS